MNPSIKNKLTASGIHFLLSSVVLLILLTIILLVWYPNNLFRAGASTGLLILVSVDLVLGPLLTFVVYNKQKKSLRFDLAVIAALQICFFLYGVLLIYNERPVIEVLADDGVNLMTLSETKEYGLNKSFSVFSQPEFVLIELPDSREGLYSAKSFSEVVDSKPYISRFDLHKPMANVSEEEYQSYLEFIYAGLLDEEQVALEEMNNNNKLENCDWVPLISYHTSGYACVNKSNGIVTFKQM